MPTSSELCEWVDRLQIRDLIEGYSNAVNRRDWDLLASLFADDGVWSVMGAHTDREVRGRDAVRREISSVVEPFELCFQVIGAVHIRLDGDRAAATSGLQDFIKIASEADMTLFGIYHDVFVRTSQGWRFQRREYRGRYFGRDALGGKVMP